MLNFSLPLRVYIEDTDAGGIVYYARYLNYMERARTEALRSLGIELDEWQHAHRRMFVVTRVEADYLKPARFNDQIRVEANMSAVRRTSVRCAQAVYRGGEKLLDASVLLACVNSQTLAPAGIPSPLREALIS